MDSKLKRLSHIARSGAKWRGHTLRKFYLVTDTLYRSHCNFCGMEVDINSKPLPNQTDISGEAIALNCRGVKEIIPVEYINR